MPCWNRVEMKSHIVTMVTPLTMFWTWLQMVRTVANSFLLPHHLSTRSCGDKACSLTTSITNAKLHNGPPLQQQMDHQVKTNASAKLNTSGRCWSSVRSEPKIHSRWTERKLTFLFFFPRRLSSRLMWLNSLRSVPLGPLTMTVRPFSLISTKHSRENIKFYTGLVKLESQHISNPLRYETDNKSCDRLTYHCRECRQSGCWEWSSFCIGQEEQCISFVDFTQGLAVCVVVKIQTCCTAYGKARLTCKALHIYMYIYV